MKDLAKTLGFDRIDTERLDPPIGVPLDPIKYRISWASLSYEEGPGMYEGKYTAVTLTPAQREYLAPLGFQKPKLTGTVAQVVLSRGGVWRPFDELAATLDSASRGNGPLAHLPESLLVFEADKVVKTNLQSGATPFWQRDYVMEVTPRHSHISDTATAMVDQWFKAAAQGLKDLMRLAHVLAGIWHFVSVPRGTNSGWPDYDKTDESKRMHLMLSLAMRNPSDWKSLEDYFGQNVYGIFFSRTGHTSKAMPWWIRESGGYHASQSIRGAATRRRAVMGVPTFLGATERSIMKTLTLAKKAFGLFKIELPHLTWARSLNYDFHYSDDLSNFDGTFTPEHFRWLRERYAPMHDITGTAWLYKQMQDIEMLTPGYNRTEGWALARDGYEASGVPHTSNDDTALNGGSMCDCSAASTGIPIDEVADSLLRDFGEGPISGKCLGDDTKISCDSPIDTTAFQAERLNHGLTSKLEPDSFLMTWYPTWPMFQKEGLRACGSYARYLQQAILPEKPQDNEEVEFIGQVERFWRIRWNPIWNIIGRKWTEQLFVEGWGVGLDKVEEKANSILATWARQIEDDSLSDAAFNYLSNFSKRDVKPHFQALADLIETHTGYFSLQEVEGLALGLLRRDVYSGFNELITEFQFRSWLERYMIK
jgi:hypothetical protein